MWTMTPKRKGFTHGSYKHRRRLLSIGEVALVPASSPINKENLLFYNTLFDENAACHIALGQGYPGTVKGGEKMTTRQLLEKGVNDSVVHEDLMIGYKDTNIIGTRADGTTVKILKTANGCFNKKYKFYKSCK